MAEQSDLDRNEAATPYKLQKAKEQGQVAKSPDVIAVAVLACAMLFLAWEGAAVWRQQFVVDRALLLRAGRGDIELSTVWPLVEYLLRTTFVLAAPFFATLAIAAVVGNVMQTGAVFSAHPIKPDWQRLDPVAGIKRVLSIRTLFLALRALLKLSLLGLVAWMSIRAVLPHFYQLSGLPAAGLMQALLADLSALGLKLAAMLGAIALLDLAFTQREFAKKMRMSKRDIKDEAKNRDGDPRIRARLRELRREMLKRSLALSKTRDADVLITNPTHVAVALRYVHGQMSSPQLIAKGQGFMAAAMRKLAARHHIPVVQNPALARALFREIPLQHHVPPELFAQVARIIVWVFARRDAQRAASSAMRTTTGAAWKR